MAGITLTKSNFENEVLKADKPVLVDFWASWCGPCRMLAPIVDEIANEYKGKVNVGKVNVDDERELAMRYGISSIPKERRIRAEIRTRGNAKAALNG